MEKETAKMSDLVAGIHAFVTENETGAMLQQRLLDIRSSTGALLLRVEAVAKSRE
jgi:hypothetical protein